MQDIHYANYLKNDFAKRRQKNRRYSLRQYASFLGLDPATLSRVFAGKAALSFEAGQKASAALGLNASIADLFLDSLVKDKIQRKRGNRGGERRGASAVIPQDTFSVIRDWYHYAILELTLTENFVSEPKWIANTLGISVLETKFAIERLLNLGLLAKSEDGILSKTSRQLTTNDRKSTSEALKEFTSAMLLKAQEAVDKTPSDKRAMFGVTMAIHPDAMPLALSLIEEYSHKICDILESGRQTHVYQLQTAFFPLQKTQQIRAK